MVLVDGFGREHDYLRISITDRCNLRCIYCMGEEGVLPIKHCQVLSFEEIILLVQALVPLGVKKVRITGGEPLVRKGIQKLLSSLNNISELKDVSLTTNGQLLAPMLDTLMDSGLKRVNISLDSLKPDVYRQITRVGDLSIVLDGIEASLKKGLNPVKLNVVLIKGINDDEILDFLLLTLDKPLHVRFIEYMPLNSNDDRWLDRYLPVEAVKKKALQTGLYMEKESNLKGNGPAEIWRIKGAKGTVGFINAVSSHFCSSCNRMRLTADGYFKPCLYWQDDIYIRDAINNPQELKQLIIKGLAAKKKKHGMLEENNNNATFNKYQSMAQIGG